MSTKTWDDTADAWASAGEKAAPWFTPGKVVAMVVAFVIFCAAVPFVGWQVGWWFKAQNNTRQALLYQNSYGTQSGLIGELNQEIVQFRAIQVQVQAPQTPAGEKSALVSQEQGIVNQACPQVGQISIRIPTNIASWAHVYCSN